jgi:hypothetical protein
VANIEIALPFSSFFFPFLSFTLLLLIVKGPGPNLYFSLSNKMRSRGFLPPDPSKKNKARRKETGDPLLAMGGNDSKSAEVWGCVQFKPSDMMILAQFRKRTGPSRALGPRELDLGKGGQRTEETTIRPSHVEVTDKKLGWASNREMSRGVKPRDASTTATRGGQNQTPVRRFRETVPMEPFSHLFFFRPCVASCLNKISSLIIGEQF